jgi:ApbE superfamily uncharacterized protein (UPF0280 family)
MATDIRKVVSDAYYTSPNMIRFLLVENLALKMLLHEKNLITPEDYKNCQKEADAILEGRLKSHLEDFVKKNPEFVEVLTDLDLPQESQPVQIHSVGV